MIKQKKMVIIVSETENVEDKAGYKFKLDKLRNRYQIKVLPNKISYGHIPRFHPVIKVS